MRHHHTKTKGDRGVIEVMAELSRRGFSILVPLAEHEAFDFVAYDAHFLRVQAKYRAAVNGVIEAPLSTCWSDRRGTHTVPMDRDQVDLFAIYCPDTGATYYVDPKLWPADKVLLRIAPTRNGQKRRVQWAHDFVDIPASVRGISGGLRMPLEIPAGPGKSREPRAFGLVYAPVAQLD